MSDNQKIRPEWVPIAYRDSDEDALKPDTGGQSKVRPLVRRVSKKFVRVKKG